MQLKKCLIFTVYDIRVIAVRNYEILLNLQNLAHEKFCGILKNTVLILILLKTRAGQLDIKKMTNTYVTKCMIAQCTKNMSIKYLKK